jgi:hypothetical protein
MWCTDEQARQPARRAGKRTAGTARQPGPPADVHRAGQSGRPARQLVVFYGYTLSIVVLDFAGHPDSIMVPVLDWVQVNEPPLMQNADRLADGLKFEAEILSTASWDFRLTIKLTERVSVQKQDDGSINIAHLPEPKADWE